MDDFLKGTYKVNKKIIDDDEKDKDVLAEKAKASIGGSMVFVERKKMVWKGDKNKSKVKNIKK